MRLSEILRVTGSGLRRVLVPYTEWIKTKGAVLPSATEILVDEWIDGMIGKIGSAANVINDLLHDRREDAELPIEDPPQKKEAN